MKTMQTMTSDLTMEQLLNRREAIGKIIIHDLLGPVYNLIALNRDLQENCSSLKEDDKKSLDLAVEISESLHSKLLSLFELSFNKNKLLSIGAFDVHELITDILQAARSKSLLFPDNITLTSSAMKLEVVGDREVTRYLLQLIFALLLERYSDHSTYTIHLHDNHELTSIAIDVHHQATPESTSAELFLEKADKIDNLAELLNTQVSMEEKDNEWVTVQIKLLK